MPLPHGILNGLGIFLISYNVTVFLINLIVFDEFFKKKQEIQNNERVLIISLLIHAARIDENYT